MANILISVYRHNGATRQIPEYHNTLIPEHRQSNSSPMTLLAIAWLILKKNRIIVRVKLSYRLLLKSAHLFRRIINQMTLA